ncbi:MAG TPA: c-type cytochrome [Candidatus Kapabacteria bacterium]|nr:c-type cytochrome [Candidatus Kapabacteria bacterium]
MKKFFKILGIVIGSIVVLVGIAALFIQLRGIPSYEPKKLAVTIDYTPERVERGRRLGNTLCADCHTELSSGKLIGKHMSDMPKEFGTVYSKNITHDPTHGIGAWTDGELVFFLRTGIARAGNFNPVMGGFPRMSDEDMYSIIAWLRSDDARLAATPVASKESEWSFLAKALAHFAFLPKEMPDKPIPTPDINDRVAYGRYIATGVADCFTCHSADFKTMDTDVPERSERFFGGGNAMPDLTGTVIHTSNITPDKETGIGAWTEQQFIRAVRDGFRPDNTPLRYPMSRYTDLTEQEIGAVYAYLRTVPAIAYRVERDERYSAMKATASDLNGHDIYRKYACYACHGDDGKGNCDLRDAHTKYPSDEALIAWIRNPSAIQPGTKMPTWEGVIAENEYAPLARYVRELGMKKRATVASR